MTTVSFDDHELALFRRTISQVRSGEGRLAWRAAMQRRMLRARSAVAGLRRAVPGAVCEKIVGGWNVTVNGNPMPVLTLITHTQGKTIADLEQPFVVHVHQRGFVELAELERLAERGAIKIVFDDISP
jgi:hypothetical protein